jgi:hypothetical protein
VLAAAKIIATEYGRVAQRSCLKGSDGRVQFAERPFDPSGADGVTVRTKSGVRP